ncbi:MAG: M1 family metallopeptidase [Phycisphaerales bacterium JB054]
MPRRFRRSIAVAVLLACGSHLPVATAQSGGSLRFDEETGRDLANYLPHRDFDHTHMLLELDFPDFEHEARATARCTLTMTPIGTPRNTIRLDATDYPIHSVTLNARPLRYDYDGEELLVTLPRAIPLGDSVTIVIDYELAPEHMVPNGRALSWSPPTRRPSDPSEEVPMLHSQGQPDDASGWFPCYDHPLERLSTELIVTAHDGYEVVSNGELLSREVQPDGRVRWHWDQKLPHAPYLVSLVIGKFDVVDVGGPATARPGLTMPVYGPVGLGERMRDVFANTPDMVAHFEKLFDEPYPWAKYSQAIVRDFAAGAMENTSATTFFPFASAAEPGSIDNIIVHELVHQWFGDLVTNRNWSHLWIQEGWATFGEALWEEEVARQHAIDAGKDDDEAAAAARRAYIRHMRGNFRSSAMGGTRTSAPEDPALASNLWNTPDLNFMKPNNPYARGACVLHMLRERLGDEVFWRGMRLYLDRYKFDAVESDDLRRVLEEVSGESLERFFDQWVYRAGAPRADVELDWQPAFEDDDDGPGTLTITLRQVQTINADNPAYAMVVPMYCRYDNGSGEYLYLVTEEREASVSARLDRAPEEVRIDPYLWNILEARITKDLDEPESVSEEAAVEGE